MGRVADGLNTVTVTVTSPDGFVKAQVKAKQPKHLLFRPGSFDAYERIGLEHQLGRLAGLCFVGYQRAVREITDTAGLRVPLDPKHARTPEQRGYLEELATLTVIGPKKDRPIVFGINGPTAWRCRIAPNILQEYPEPEFVTACLTAAEEFMTRFEFEKMVLRNKHFGSGRLNTTGLRPWDD